MVQIGIFRVFVIIPEYVVGGFRPRAKGIFCGGGRGGSGGGGGGGGGGGSWHLFRLQVHRSFYSKFNQPCFTSLNYEFEVKNNGITKKSQKIT